MTALMATILIFAANLCCVPMIAASLSPDGWLTSCFGSLPPRRTADISSPTPHFLSKRVVRLGFIIGFIALIGVLLSGLAAYRVHEQELTVDGIALARAIDVHASLVQDRLTERELLSRVASGLFRAPSVIKANMLQPLRSSIYTFKTDFNCRKLDRPAEAERTGSCAQGTRERRIYESDDPRFR